MFSVIFFALAVVGAIAHLVLDKQPRTRERVLEIAFSWWLGVTLGAGGLFAASGHLFIPDEVAESIGWAPGSPFQREVGFANLALGTIAVLSTRVRGTFREATVIALAIYLFGAAVGHVIEITETGNTAEYNAGPILYTDVLEPLIAIILLVALRREQRQQPSDVPARDRTSVAGSNSRTY